MALELGGGAGVEAVGLAIVGDDGAGGDHAARADGDAGHGGDVAADPAAVADDDGAAVAGTGAALEGPSW